MKKTTALIASLLLIPALAMAFSTPTELQDIATGWTGTADEFKGNMTYACREGYSRTEETISSLQPIRFVPYSPLQSTRYARDSSPTELIALDYCTVRTPRSYYRHWMVYYTINLRTNTIENPRVYWWSTADWLGMYYPMP